MGPFQGPMLPMFWASYLWHPSGGTRPAAVSLLGGGVCRSLPGGPGTCLRHLHMPEGRAICGWSSRPHSHGCGDARPRRPPDGHALGSCFRTSHRGHGGASAARHPSSLAVGPSSMGFHGGCYSRGHVHPSSTSIYRLRRSHTGSPVPSSIVGRDARTPSPRLVL